MAFLGCAYTTTDWPLFGDRTSSKSTDQMWGAYEIAGQDQSKYCQHPLMSLTTP